MNATERNAVVDHERKQEHIGSEVERSQAGGKDTGQAVDGGVHQFDRRDEYQTLMKVMPASQYESGADQDWEDDQCSHRHDEGPQRTWVDGGEPHSAADRDE